MRGDRSRLLDILAAIERIQAEIGSRTLFKQDEKLQVWALYHLQVIGEACRSLSEEFRKEHPDQVWQEAVGLRNILIHHYFEIDEELVWIVIERDLPPFRVIVERALANL